MLLFQVQILLLLVLYKLFFIGVCKQSTGPQHTARATDTKSAILFNEEIVRKDITFLQPAFKNPI